MASYTETLVKELLEDDWDQFLGFLKTFKYDKAIYNNNLFIKLKRWVELDSNYFKNNDNQHGNLIKDDIDHDKNESQNANPTFRAHYIGRGYWYLTIKL